ncbi:hypothetical protein E2C01_037180 [Portunus trituberculatus]|uniref:Uncharacterized protein n=1 Tax=Portunus trituberculatus TaxID=210409 RepID=A0A5B7F8N6_PORTR|nr:hypothetical protein [Portunus trituberculatus]
MAHFEKSGTRSDIANNPFSRDWRSRPSARRLDAKGFPPRSRCSAPSLSPLTSQQQAALPWILWRQVTGK